MTAHYKNCHPDRTLSIVEGEVEGPAFSPQPGERVPQVSFLRPGFSLYSGCDAVPGEPL